MLHKVTVVCPFKNDTYTTNEEDQLLTTLSECSGPLRAIVIYSLDVHPDLPLL